MARTLAATLALATVAAAAAATSGTATAAAHHRTTGTASAAGTTTTPPPMITAFFPQQVGVDMSASVVAVHGAKTTLEMCMDGLCDEEDLMWTFVYGASTAAIELTAQGETLTIGCDVTMTKDRAACSFTDKYKGTTSTDRLVMDSLTDFVTTIAVTAGASLLTDLSASATATAPVRGSPGDGDDDGDDDDDNNDDDDDKKSKGVTTTFSLTLPSRTLATTAETAAATAETAAATAETAAATAETAAATAETAAATAETAAATAAATDDLHFYL
jgi:hypothetical protein